MASNTGGYWKETDYAAATRACQRFPLDLIGGTTATAAMNRLRQCQIEQPRNTLGSGSSSGSGCFHSCSRVIYYTRIFEEMWPIWEAVSSTLTSRDTKLHRLLVRKEVQRAGRLDR